MTDYTHLQLTSERIRLVPIGMEYAQDICTHFTAEITQYMWPSAPKTQEEINQHITTQQFEMKNGKEISMIITDKNTDEFFGYASIHQADTNTPELGIWLKKSAHGYHYGSEALYLLKNWAEDNLTYKYLKYPVEKKNAASRKLAEKLGGKVKDEYIKKSESGKLLDEVEYRFIKINKGITPIPDGQLYFETAGNGEPIILIHAGFSDHRDWTYQFEAFSELFQTVRYDQRGSANSSIVKTAFSPADDLKCLMDHLNIEKAVLIGHSFGGRVRKLRPAATLN